jgi:hypothetical protein
MRVHVGDKRRKIRVTHKQLLLLNLVLAYEAVESLLKFGVFFSKSQHSFQNLISHPCLPDVQVMINRGEMSQK